MLLMMDDDDDDDDDDDCLMCYLRRVAYCNLIYCIAPKRGEIIIFLFFIPSLPILFGDFLPCFFAAMI